MFTKRKTLSQGHKEIDRRRCEERVKNETLSVVSSTLLFQFQAFNVIFLYVHTLVSR